MISQICFLGACLCALGALYFPLRNLIGKNYSEDWVHPWGMLMIGWLILMTLGFLSKIGG